MDCSLPVSSVHGIFQARILEWVATSYSKGSSWPRDGTKVFCGPCVGTQILYHWATWEALRKLTSEQFPCNLNSCIPNWEVRQPYTFILLVLFCLSLLKTVQEVQFCSVTQLSPTLCYPMDCSMPGFPVHHELLACAQKFHVHGTISCPSNHLILCHPLLLLPSIFHSIRGISKESVLCIRWPKY